jgi:alkylation response protein AidB-like acyl-CoA dehydrogenase
MSVIVNRRDLEFLLYECEQVDRLFELARYAHLDRETVDSMMDSAQSLAEQFYLPVAAKVDAQAPRFAAGGEVVVPQETATALRAYADAGLFAQTFEQTIGGLELPYVVSTAINGLFSAANQSIANYSMLTVAAAHLLAKWGSEQQKTLFLSKLLQGQWLGTMCLSEPQAGSSLADITTRAESASDGTWRIRGTKMWISGGEHNISENIVHLVLAKIPGGPPGVKGISLFIVPKRWVGERGELGDTNNITLVGLNHKMGQRGTTNCLLNFGERGPTRAYLVGEPHQGLRYMFDMMNEARISVGHGAVTSGLVGYLYSLDYASERRQGRLPGHKDATASQVPIIQHPDVKRMLLAQKAAVEGALALIFYCASLVDRKAVAAAGAEAEAADLELLLQTLTPIAKSWPSEHCLEANKWAIQVLGGAGYTVDHPVERLYRDNRLNHIHEGAYGIQALDLLGRKVRLSGGRGLELLFTRIRATLAIVQHPDLQPWARALTDLIEHWRRATQACVQCPDDTLGLANATAYLDAAGHVVVGWLWLRQANIACGKLASAGEADRKFYEAKILACRYFFRYVLPGARLMFDLVQSLDETCMVTEPEHLHAGR